MCTYSPPRFALQLCDVFAEWRTANRGNKTSPHTQQKWRTHLLFFSSFFFLSFTTSLWQIRQGRNAYAFSLSVNCLFFFFSMCLSGVVYLLFFPLASFFFLALFFFFLLCFFFFLRFVVLIPDICVRSLLFFFFVVHWVICVLSKPRSFLFMTYGRWETEAFLSFFRCFLFLISCDSGIT